MFSDPFMVDYDATVASGSHEQNYVLMGYPTGTSTLRKNSAVDDGTVPEALKLSHQVSGKGDNVRDRHLARFEVSSVDGDSNVGLSLPAVGYVVFDIPRNNITENIQRVLARQIAGFLRTANADDSAGDYTVSGNVDRWCNGES